MNWKVQLCELNYSAKETEAVNSVISSKWITMGERVKKFEKDFQNYLGANFLCTTTSSCTAALHMSLLSLGVKNGDEVVIPALTFVADANVVKMVGARPVLADCKSLNDWNVSLKTIKKCVTAKTKAIIVVHFAGYPCDIIEISKFCNERNIFLIEDVAHAPGASCNGQKVGTFGDFGCFSFFSNKNLAVGEGGMVVAQKEENVMLLQKLRSHGMTSLTLDRHKGRSSSYDVIMPGLNYRIDEIRASLGIVQLTKLDAGNEKRKNLTELYRSSFYNTDLLIPFDRHSDCYTSAYHILPVLLPKYLNRSKVIECLKNKGIQTSIHYPSFSKFSYYNSHFNPINFPVCEEICNRELTLPLHPTMQESDVDFVASSLLSML